MIHPKQHHPGRDPLPATRVGGPDGFGVSDADGSPVGSAGEPGHPAGDGEPLFPDPKRRLSALARGIALVSGVVLVILGIILGILPVVPGFPLIALGVLLLVASSESTRRALNAGERRLPGRVRGLLRRIVRSRAGGARR